MRSSVMAALVIFALVVAVLVLGGCAGVFGYTWGMQEYSATNVVPAVGYYDFVLEKTENAAYVPTSGFYVEKKAGKPVLRFASDNYRFDDLAVTQGRFYNAWGDLDKHMNFPTDSYGLSGHFITTKVAKGQVKYASDGKIRQVFNFTATLRE
ncbi:MAG: hypothetical protein WCP21_17255 [Armatimonadota bacterium]